MESKIGSNVVLAFFKQAGEYGNEKKAKIFSDTIGVDLEHGKVIFLDLLLVIRTAVSPL